jgi:hypothetical protein
MFFVPMSSSLIGIREIENVVAEAAVNLAGDPAAAIVEYVLAILEADNTLYDAVDYTASRRSRTGSKTHCPRPDVAFVRQSVIYPPCQSSNAH